MHLYPLTPLLIPNHPECWHVISQRSQTMNKLIRGHPHQSNTIGYVAMHEMYWVPRSSMLLSYPAISKGPCNYAYRGPDQAVILLKFGAKIEAKPSMLSAGGVVHRRRNGDVSVVSCPVRLVTAWAGFVICLSPRYEKAFILSNLCVKQAGLWNGSVVCVNMCLNVKLRPQLKEFLVEPRWHLGSVASDASAMHLPYFQHQEPQKLSTKMNQNHWELDKSSIGTPQNHHMANSIHINPKSTALLDRLPKSSHRSPSRS